ncbi:MAG: hypothetical protein R6X22_02070 [Gemmatimonadota bacterium]
MIDKNRFSGTYGCFDREYWHYRTIDFPCGMSQEFCLPLALAFKYPFPHNPYYQNERLRELVIAAIRFARKSTHPDGSCDDYFPHERALGAHVFSTYALTESYLELGLDASEFRDFFRLRGDWLIANNESGRLSNHQALAALALYNVYLVTGDDRFSRASNDFREITLSWQHEEGWFQEYEGADPGYHSCTISFLGKLWQKSADDSLKEPLTRAVEFAAHFMHPDGSYGGEYGSRNTYHFYPHGFEIWAQFSPTAARVAETYLTRSMPERRRYFNDDNRMCAHYVYDWMQAWRDYHPDRQGLLEEHREPFERWFEGAGLLVKKTGTYYAVASLAKGGVLKVFDEEGPLHSDTGLMLRTVNGDTLVSHLIDPEHAVRFDPAEGTATVTGPMSRRRQPLSSPLKQVIFRLMNLTLGRLGPDLVRRLLQRILITGKQRSGFRFERRITFARDHVCISDAIDAGGGDHGVVEIAVGSDATSIYVANSNTFQESTLIPWRDCSEFAAALNRDGRVTLPSRCVPARKSHATGTVT